MNGISATPITPPAPYGATAAGAGRTLAHFQASSPPLEPASALCSFSAESLERLGAETVAERADADPAAPEVDALPLADTWTSVATTANEWATDLSSLAHGGWDTLADTASAVGDSITDTASAAAHAMEDAAEHTAHALGAVTDALGSGAKNAASYLALGWSAARATLNELA